ncbi:MAG: hypothetical protein K9W44_14840 [Candidatus Lokiarchaeota archaeon]|nr:hypothetical protein [Candidatus Harpocratesius repetitus]
MVKNSLETLFVIRSMILGSGIILLISFFLPIINTYSLFDLIRIFSDIRLKLLYMVPILNAIFRIFIALFLPRFLKKRKLWLYLLLIFDINITTLFLSDIFQEHNPYLWQNVAIYGFIFATVLYLIGFLRILLLDNSEINTQPTFN